MRVRASGAALAVRDQDDLAGRVQSRIGGAPASDVLAAQRDRVGAVDDRAVLEREADDLFAGMKSAKQALGRKGHEGRGREGRRPVLAQLARDRRQQRRLWRAPVVRQ